METQQWRLFLQWHEFNEASGHRKLALNSLPSPFISLISSGLWALPHWPRAFEKHKSRYVPAGALLNWGFLLAHIRPVLTYLSESWHVPGITQVSCVTHFSPLGSFCNLCWVEVPRCWNLSPKKPHTCTCKELISNHYISAVKNSTAEWLLWCTDAKKTLISKVLSLLFLHCRQTLCS